MKPSELTNFLQFSISNRFPVLITGKPGIGKTDCVDKACQLPVKGHDGKEYENAELIISHPVVSDPTDFKGLPFPTYSHDNGPSDPGHKIAEFLPFGELDKLIRANRPTVFFMDDLGQAPASVQAAAMQLILARRINGHKVSEHVTFIAATNRREDKAGVSGILEPVKSRFASIVELEVNTEDWVRWALESGMPTELIAFIRFKPALLSDFQPTKEMKNSSSPRTVANVGKMQLKGLSKDLEFEVFKGAAGEAFAAEYSTFLKLFRELPDIDEIITNPDKAPIVEQPGTKYALAGALSAKASDQNFGAIIRYMKRLESPEITVVFVKDAQIRNRSVVKCRAFTDWAAANAGLLM